MAQGSTLYRIKLELSDIDRSVYESLAFRVARHPSESTERLVARVLAYALLYEEGLEFGKGLSADEPALWAHDLTGQLLHWVDVGTPKAERIHTASKKAQRVSIVCHHGRDALAREMQRRKIHQAGTIEVRILDPELTTAIADSLERDSDWTVVHTTGELSVSVQDRNYTGSVTRIPLPQ